MNNKQKESLEQIGTRLISHFVYKTKKKLGSFILVSMENQKCLFCYLKVTQFPVFMSNFPSEISDMDMCDIDWRLYLDGHCSTVQRSLFIT